MHAAGGCERVVLTMAAHKPRLCMPSFFSMAEASSNGIFSDKHAACGQFLHRRNRDIVRNLAEFLQL
jgi:hypothetical protein